MATHSSILVWKIPWREEPGRLHVHGVAESDTAEHTREHQQGTHTWALSPCLVFVLHHLLELTLEKAC